MSGEKTGQTRQRPYNLALIYTAMKDYETAETYGEKAVAILQHLFPNGHPNLDLYKRNLERIKRRGKR